MRGSYDFPLCGYAGCTDRPYRSKGMCLAHFNLTSYNTGAGGKAWSLTEAQRADIARRVRRFENPLALAKEYGVDRRTVLRIASAS